MEAVCPVGTVAGMYSDDGKFFTVNSRQAGYVRTTSIKSEGVPLIKGHHDNCYPKKGSD